MPSTMLVPDRSLPHPMPIINKICVLSQNISSTFQPQLHCNENAGANRPDICKCRSINFGIDVAAGELKSPGYPAGYCNNLSCKYEIDAAPGHSIHLSIISFETELRHDFLEIQQTFIAANTQHSARIAMLSGKDIGQPSFASSVSNGFILKFITDSTETFVGFHARFFRVNTTSPNNSCPIFFYEAMGEDKVLPSPPSNFAYSAGCVYMLNTSEGHGIKLNLKSLASMAKFTVYETENYQVSTDHNISPLSENVGLMVATPKEIISRTNSILIQIKVVQRELFPAKTHSKFLFEAKFSRTDSQLQLEQYAIDSTHHNAIIVEIHAFNLEHGSDFVHFLDRSKHSSRHLISRTGELSTSRNRFFTFNGKTAMLRMITDSTVTNNGFNMNCRCKGEVQPMEFSLLAGMFSFNSPIDCGFLDCFFQFNRPVTALDTDRIRLIVNITYTFKNGEEEFLEVLTNINNYNIIPSHLNERDITIFEPTLAESGTEEVTNDSPIMIWYHLASDINKHAAQFDFGYKWKLICECGSLELEAKEGLWKQLTSPDYPSHYCNLMKCQYLITAPQEYIVVANITELALEPNEDMLVFFDGPNITDRRIRITTGIEIFTDLLRSTGEAMTVYFETDISITNKGFILYYTAENASTNDRSSAAHELNESKVIISCTLLFVVTGIVFGLTYYKQLLCFANRRNRWHSTSIIGFTNLSHENSS
ncbi:Angiomotin [Dirofilaria immitis]|nr:Angiomotin [Dirofilaria immitis]